ncbi:MAG: transcription elongation factor GreA [Chloroflexota bacterium]|nr:transcription elongation factor GreA [Chloroflexota bacterium]MDE2857844.1 transcription elongation factor GreA [Chloroflexota bacterium]MDE2951586.1 transcription elongation factor GreA [Chloroflexota bacterium]
MSTDETYLTKEGESELRKELQELVERRRPALARKLKDAVAQGDLKENADYHDAKEQLGFIEGRVQHIEAILRNATVVDNAGPSDEVRIGSVVVIREDGTGEDEEYRIVGSAEANPRERKISQKSPIGSALLGKTRGRKVDVKTPDGIVKFKIVDIR